MWWLNRKRTHQQVRTLTIGGVLDEQTFWQIVRAEKERADRSGVPVTVAVFTVNDDDTQSHSLSGWNAAALCSALRSTARLTDYVGIAGDNELGVVLWGTRELGAYRFVNRLGQRAEKLAAECKLFVYPTLSGHPPSRETEKDRDQRPSASGHQILDRIADVEQKIAEAMEIETAVVQDEDLNDHDDSFGFGSEEVDLRNSEAADALTDPPAPAFSASSGGGLATMIDRTASKAEAAVDRTDDELLSRGEGVKITARSTPAASTGQMNIVMEPLENLFLFPHPIWKRTLDVVGAGVGLVLLSPLLAAVAAAVKLSSPGPVLFKQLREGHGGRLFTIYKFRTMRVGADAEKAELAAANEQHGPAFKMANDPRITAIGSFLRKTCLDELPQLWNVLIGNMTLVGPRPLDFRESTRIARWGRRRLHVMPGLTCIWQVHGKSKVTFNEWMRMDIRYSQKVSFWRDAKLMLATFRQMILRKASH